MNPDFAFILCMSIAVNILSVGYLIFLHFDKKYVIPNDNGDVKSKKITFYVSEYAYKKFNDFAKENDLSIEQLGYSAFKHFISFCSMGKYSLSDN